MSCPDWNALHAAREADPLVDPPGFAAARAHLADCRDCRRAAARVDPLLLFAAPGNTPGPTGSAARPDLEMQSAVLALVRASRVAAPPAAPRARAGRRAGQVAAAIVLTSLLGLSGGPPVDGSRERAGSAGTVADLASPAELARWVDETAILAQPAVEDVDRPEARIYDLSQADLAVVMIVDASLDV